MDTHTNRNTHRMTRMSCICLCDGKWKPESVVCNIWYLGAFGAEKCPDITHSPCLPPLLIIPLLLLPFLGFSICSASRFQARFITG